MATRYLLEVYKRKGSGLQLDRAIALPPTATMSMGHRHATKLEYTLGDLPIREHGTNRRIPIQLSGNSGLSQRQGQGRAGKSLLASGPELFIEFREFLNDYQEQAKREGAQYLLSAGKGLRTLRRGTTMILRALDDDISLLVEPLTLTPSRDTSANRFTYAWTLSLDAYGRSKLPQAKSPLADVDAAKAAVETAGKAKKTATSLDGLLASGRDRIDAGNTYVLGLRRPLLRFKRSAATLDALTTDARRLATAPISALADVYQAASSLGSALRTLTTAGQTAGVATHAELSRLRYLLSGVEETERDSLAALGAAGGKLADLEAATAADAFISPLARVLADEPDQVETAPVTLGNGDTLGAIAERYLGDAAQWPALAELNGMLGYATKGDGKPLVVGDQVNVPAVASSLPVQDAKDPYGTDWYVDPETGDFAGASEDVIFNDAGGAGITVVVSQITSLRKVSGPQNAVQALRLRLGTEQGRWTLRPGFGIAPRIGDKLTATTQGAVLAQADDQMRADPRVARLRQLEVLDLGVALRLTADVELVSGHKIGVLAEVPAG